MYWVLIIISSWGMSDKSPVTVTTIDFYREDACTTAQKTIEDSIPMGQFTKTYCVSRVYGTLSQNNK